MTRSSHYSYSS